MPSPEEESLLEETKMSFGEHLEELRRAVFKSVIALAVAFAVALFFASDIVDYVQTPLRASLERYYIRQAEREQRERLEAMKLAGFDVPADLDAAAARIANDRLVPREIYVAPEELAKVLEPDFPEAAKSLAAGKKLPQHHSARDGLIRVPFYQPLEEDPRMRIVELNAEGPFVTYIKAAFLTAFVIAAPFVFYFLWEFVADGLYKHEKKYIHTFLPMSLALFVAGAAVAFYLAFGFVLDFLFGFFEKMRIDPDPRLSEWLTFVLLMPLGFGVSFQLPIVMLALERIGIFTVQNYKEKWKIAVLVIAFLAMVLSPGGDPYSMSLMGAPLVVLYFGGIWLCQVMPGAKRAGTT